MAAGLLVMVLVLLVVVVLVPAAAGTANDQWPDLLPKDCGTRLVQLDDFSRFLIVGTGNLNTTAYYGQFPWQARVEVYNRTQKAHGHQCGGVIITQRHVITAAHCVDHVALTSMQVRVGDLRFGRKDENEQVFSVADCDVHYHFGDGRAYANDIALLRLKVRRGVGIEFSGFVQPACLPEPGTEYEPNTECEVSGWGQTADYLGAPISETLRGVPVPLVSDEFCSSLEVYQAQFVPGRMFCAGLVRGGPDACGGDSGGPLVCRDPSNDRFVAYGIVSSGDLLGCGQLPGLYTKLSGFIFWLLARLQLDFICLHQTGSLDSMVTVTVNGWDQRTYAFQGDQYWLLTNTGVKEGYPRLIRDDWDGVPDNLDEVFYDEEYNRIYFFKGSQYWRWTNMTKDTGYPRQISSDFPGVPDNIDAALRWIVNGELYFFKGSQYWKFENNLNNSSRPGVSDIYPLPISLWVGIPDNIDSAMTHENNRTYFFKGDIYYRFNDDSSKVDSSYPRSIEQYWFGCRSNSVPPSGAGTQPAPHLPPR